MRVRKCGQKKNRKKKTTKKQAWDSFSLYIRTLGNFTCVQCGATKEDGAILQSGHVIPCGQGHSIRFLEDDVFCQCQSCNFKHSQDNYDYFEWFKKIYGESKLHDIKSLKNTTGYLWVNMVSSFNKNDYASIKEYYDHKLLEIKDNSSEIA